MGGGAFVREQFTLFDSRGGFLSLINDVLEDTVEEFQQSPTGHRRARLTTPVSAAIDLSSIRTGQAFIVRVVTHARTFDRANGTVSGIGAEFATAAHAFLRDPVVVDGTTVVTQGLTQVDTPIPAPDPGDAPVTPAPCTPGPAPDPAAGTIQFERASYVQNEGAAFSEIKITRLGGTRGEVSATLRTSNGTAIEGVDYSPINSSVFFGDGDDAPRTVPVPIIQDTEAREPDKTLTITLSQPGGCAALGDQSTTELIIRDDDRGLSAPSGLDPTFDADGKATLAAFGGDRSAMAVQPDGKIVMVGGTFVDLVMARFNADGTLDRTFGVDGRVTTNLVTGEQEEALGVAIQPDGKIVVVGYTGQAVGPSVIALARYTANGALDTTFGTSGIVVTNLVGRAFAVALEPGSDPKIVIAGDNPTAEDFVVARFNSDGTPDGTFGGVGHVVTDVGGAGDTATNIVLQPDGAILVSGGNSVGLSNSALARYLPNGSLDASFGNGGRLPLPGRRLGEGLALQSDGKIILAGDADGATLAAPVFALMRLEPNGNIDPSFGGGGLITTAITTQGDEAFALALQADNRIVAAGRSNAQTNSNFAIARYLATGELDPAFGNGDGFMTVDFFGFTDIAESVAIDSVGRIVVGGLARDDVDGYGVARINP
jgi:uncharacterized delta-60 repeat protein